MEEESVRNLSAKLSLPISPVRSRDCDVTEVEHAPSPTTEERCCASRCYASCTRIYANCMDRFIPRRAMMDLDHIHHQVMTSAVDEEDVLSKFHEAPFRELRRLVGDVTSSSPLRKPLFHFGSPAPQKTRCRFSSVGSMCGDLGSNTGRSCRECRRLPRQPDVVLDLPGFQDDFYQNSMDWSSSDVLTVSLGTAVHTWNPRTNSRNRVWLQDHAHYQAVAWEPQGTQLALGDSKGRVQVWDLVREKLVCCSPQDICSHPDYCEGVLALTWSPRNRTLVSGNCLGHLHVYDVRDRRPLQTRLDDMPKAHVGLVCGLRFSPDGRYLASSGHDGAVYVWDGLPLKKAPKFTIHGHCDAVRALAWHPLKSSVLATGGSSGDGAICIWNVNSEVLKAKENTSSSVCCLQWSERTSELVSSHWVQEAERSEVVVWSHLGDREVTRSSSGKVVGKLNGHTGRVLYLLFSPDKTQLATAASDEALRIWRFTEKPKPRSGSSSDVLVDRFSHFNTIR